MFKKILIANRGDNAPGVAVEGDFTTVKSAATKPRCTRSVPGDRAE